MRKRGKRIAGKYIKEVKMLALKVILEGDGCWRDLKGKEIIHVTEGIQLAMLKEGMKSGASSVAIRIDLPDGKTVMAETSLKLFIKAAAAFEAAS